MRDIRDLRRSIEYLPTAGVEPIFILDTSAIIDLEEHDPVGLRAFLDREPANRIATPGVFMEIQRHYHTLVGRRRVIPEDLLVSIESALQETAPLHQCIVNHHMYDHHRYTATGIAQEICSVKKREHDPISHPDSHTLAITLTLAAHCDELNLPNRYPVVLTADEHLYRPLEYLGNPLIPEHYPGYHTVRILKTRP